MPFWNKKIKIDKSIFVEREFIRSITTSFEAIKTNLEVIGPIPEIEELKCFVAFLPVLAMTLERVSAIPIQDSHGV